MQHFAANTILQRKTGNYDADILFTLMPYKLTTLKIIPIKELLKHYYPHFFLLSILPLVFHFMWAVTSAKAAGLPATVKENPAKYWLSWWLAYTTVACCTTTLQTILSKFIMFDECSFFFIWTMIFLAHWCFFGLIWLCQALTKSTKDATLIFGFAFFMCVALDFVVD